MTIFNELLSISNESKYTKWYVSICKKAQSRILQTTIKAARKEAKKIFGYIEAHHIIPQCICSDQQKTDFNNLAFLTAKEHFLCHWLLCKMFDGETKYKMQHAFSMFLQESTTQGRKLTSRQFETIKRNIKEALSESAKKRFKGVKKSPEHIEKLKIARSKRPKGYKLSEEHKRNIGLGGKGRIASEETRKKMSEQRRGRTLSEEHKKKISETRKLKNIPSPTKGKKYSEEAKEKMRKKRKDSSTIGKYERTPEFRERMAEQRKGRGIGSSNVMSSEENKAKVRASKIGRKRFYNKYTNESKYLYPETIDTNIWLTPQEFKLINKEEQN